MMRRAFISESKARKRLARAHRDEVRPARGLRARAVSVVQAITICSTISPAVSVRSSPSFAVRQKSHCKGQPDCDEKQIVSRLSPG
jgi:hypothetical protein